MREAYFDELAPTSLLAAGPSLSGRRYGHGYGAGNDYGELSITTATVQAEEALKAARGHMTRISALSARQAAERAAAMGGRGYEWGAGVDFGEGWDVPDYDSDQDYGPAPGQLW